jgi:hypothetical protein
VKDVNNVSDADQEARFESVLQRFGDQIRGGAVQVHRDYSEDAAVFFEDGQLDWIYVDGMHTVDAVYQDLAVYRNKVKPDGFILGHDYTNHAFAQEEQFGVVEAVNRCVIEMGYEFVALTMEGYPTYLIAKNSEAPSARQLKEDLVAKVPFVVEIREFPHARHFEHRSVRRGEKLLVYPSF